MGKVPCYLNHFSFTLKKILKIIKIMGNFIRYQWGKELYTWDESYKINWSANKSTATVRHSGMVV